MKVDEDYGKSVVIFNAKARKVWQSSSNAFWKNIGCLVLDPIFDSGVSRLLEK